MTTEPKIQDLPPKIHKTKIKLPNGSYRLRIRLETQGTSRTLQEPTLDTDIHNIMKKYVHTHGSIPMAQITNTILDFSDSNDYQEHLNRIIEAEQAFASLPATIRRDFQNDPKNLVAFLSDDKNYDKAVEYGFIDPSVALQRKNSQNPSSGSTPLSKDTPS